MRINIAEFIAQAGLAEPFYPGKRIVKACPQPGEFKCHCVVYDWRDPNRIRVEVKAGLSGNDLSKKQLAFYPVSFQIPTYIEIDVASGNVSEHRRFVEDEEGEGEATEGSGSSDSKGHKKKRSLSAGLNSFAEAVKGAVPNLGTIKDVVVMGKHIAVEAYGTVLMTFADQAAKGKILASELMSKAGSLVTRFTPPPFLKATGTEDAVYKYDRVKNEPMFGMGLT
jgi:hypothetical protein